MALWAVWHLDLGFGHDATRFSDERSGALETVSRVIKQQVVGDEMRALYIGVGFGSFLSSLGS